MNKLNMETKNIVNENIIKIRSLFPNVVFETKKGLEVDFDLLKLELKIILSKIQRINIS